MSSYPIVGSYYRRQQGGQAILSQLKMGTRLVLRPEPENLVDPYAVKVLVAAKEISKTQALEEALAGYGIDIGEIEEGDVNHRPEPLWHLGYVPKSSSPIVAAKLNGNDGEGELAFSPSGEPQVRIR